MNEAASKRLRDLEMREAAREVMFQYGLALDTNNFALLGQIFADDIVLDRPPGEKLYGRDAVTEFFTAALAHDVDSRKHFITNATITHTSEHTVVADSCVFALDHHDGELRVAWGRYRMNIQFAGDNARVSELGIYLDMPIAPVRSMLGSD
jgi:ketosteroid isomerase-like protein